MKGVFYKTAKVLLLMVLLFIITGCTQSEKPDQEDGENNPVVEEKEPEKEDTAPDDEDEKEPTVGDYFPVTLGSTWQYLGEGNEYASFKREIIFAEENRAQMKEDNGGTVSASVFEITEEAVTRIFFQGESYENGNFLKEEPNDNLVVLKTPLQVGTKWETDDSTREIVEIDATLDTPAGKFDQVVKIKITHPDSTMFEYYQEGAGMIKREFISGDFQVTSTLEKYEIRKP